MVSRKLLAAYSALSFLVLAVGALTVTLDIIWRASNPLRNLIISKLDLNVGLVIGIMYILTFALAVAAIIQPNHVTRGLIILNWALIFDATVTVIVGSIVWFYTLQERDNFFKSYSLLPPDKMQKIQDMLQCCGYFNSTDLVVSTGFCQNASSPPVCVAQITARADYTLNNIFSSVYGFMAIVAALFLASMCVVKVRNEEERFRKIDEKRGGRGFV